MSKKKSNDDAPLTDLSSLDFGPAWARDPGPKKHSSGHSDSSSNKRGSSHDKRDSRRDGKRPPRRRNQNDDRRDSRDQRHNKPRRPAPAPAPEGITARLMPIEEGMDAMAKQITQTARTHSVFDLAWVVLGNRDGCNVIFESPEAELYKSSTDHSLWLTQAECLSHFWSNDQVSKYYEAETVEVDPPSGNFQSVARCGMSGELLGAPNYHGYQQKIAEFHQERFSNMSLDRYKEKIVMEHGEEAVQQWLDKMKQQQHWRAKGQSAQVAEAPADDSSEETDAGQTPETTPEAPATPATPEPVFHTRKEVEQHFLLHGFASEYEAGKQMSVLASVPAKKISPGLLTLLISTMAEEKRYPGKLASFLCRQMTGRHLAVFKWKKRLHCGPARPRVIPDGLAIADRPATMMKWVTENPNGNVDQLWKDVLPADVDDETKHQWYHDLHWLINEGYALLFSDGTLHAAKEIAPSAPAPKAEKKSAKSKPEAKPEASKEQSEQKDDADAPKEKPDAPSE